MTKEELRKEAGDYAEKHAFRVPYDGSNKFYDDVDFKASEEGYLAGAEPREKRIAELEAQIEKMRNFQNCDYQLHIIDCPIFKSGGHISCKKCPHWILQEESE